MAIARDTFVDTQYNSGSTTQTRTLTNTGGTVMFVNTATNTPDTCSGVTWNGVSMTLITSVVEPAARTFYTYKLLNPATGSNDLVVTSSGTAGIYSNMATYTGANTSTQPDASGTASGTGITSLSKDLTSTVADTWGFCWGRSDANGISGGTNLVDLGAFASLRAFDSNTSLGTAGTETLQFTCADSGGMYGIFLLIKPPLGPSNGGHNYGFNTNKLRPAIFTPGHGR